MLFKSTNQTMVNLRMETNFHLMIFKSISFKLDAIKVWKAKLLIKLKN